MITNEHQIVNTESLSVNPIDVDKTKVKSTLIAIACLAFFPLMYLIGTWISNI